MFVRSWTSTSVSLGKALRFLRSDRPAADRPARKHESAVAKATYVRTRGVLASVLQRRDLKWHGYEARRSEFDR